jgi:glucosamine--fructose-6-phosphate aminotransferase (isomerizing)
VSEPRDAVLRREILAQPEVLERFRTREGDHVRELGRRLAQRDIRGVLIAARGSSDNAAVYAKYLFGARLRIPVALAAPSLVTRYGALPRVGGWLVVGISQSGASPDIVTVLRNARAQGCSTLAISDHQDSPLASAANDVIELHVGGETGVAATMTFTATLYALAHLACAWGEPAETGEIEGVPERVRGALEAERSAADLSEALSTCPACVVLGRGFAFPVALEWALKLKEVAGLWAEPYSAADYRHGPIALASADLAALLVDPEGPGRSDLEDLRGELARRGVKTVRAADDPSAELFFPGGPEWLSPIPATVAGQLLALHLAWARNRDPDHPQGISKVTRTL